VVTKNTAIQFIRYTGVGGTAAIVEWTSFAFLIGVVHFHYLAAVVGSFIVATAANYLLSIRFVFGRGRHSLHKEAFMVYMVSGVGLLLNMLLMWFFVGRLGIPAMTAKIIATGIVFFWNFGSRKMFVFAG